MPKKENKTNKKTYLKPEINKEKGMNFMYAAIKGTPSKIACRQCSSCHGCR
ncbi:MAG: hypothetical protein KAV87_17405 [Desulfobacteraceae bacterium]|nr:hypothetical protein [Desulfobacteraceae bacterium]